MRGWIVSMLAAAALCTTGAGAVAAAPPGSPWGAGYVPDVSLVTHEGKTVRFYEDLIKDKVVVISFIYTRCGFACPLIVANLARVQELLGDRVGRDIFLYSISIDPENDTPEALREYAEAFGAGPGWTFLTGRPKDIELLRARFGEREEVEEHAPQIRIGNGRTDRWRKSAALVDPAHLARIIADWAGPDRRPGAPREGPGDAPPPPSPAPGGADMERGSHPPGSGRREGNPGPYAAIRSSLSTGGASAFSYSGHSAQRNRAPARSSSSM